MAKVIVSKNLWYVRTALVGGRWNLDALGGLLNGVLYINKDTFNGRMPKTLTLTDSAGGTVTVETLEGAVVGDVTLDQVEDTQVSIVVVVESPEDSTTGNGIVSIDGQFTEDDGDAGSIDAYTKSETDTKLGLKANSADVYSKTAADARFAKPADIPSVANLVVQNATPKTTKANAGSSSAVSALATGATLEQVVTKVNEIIGVLNTVRSTAGSAYSVVNQLIDNLTTGKTMAP